MVTGKTYESCISNDIMMHQHQMRESKVRLTYYNISLCGLELQSWSWRLYHHNHMTKCLLPILNNFFSKRVVGWEHFWDLLIRIWETKCKENLQNWNQMYLIHYFDHALNNQALELKHDNLGRLQGSLQLAKQSNM